MDKKTQVIYFFLMALPVEKKHTYARYLPVNKEALRWEIHCNHAGYSHVPPHASYPLLPEDHPATYAATVTRGRVLKEFQVVYVTSGEGIFESGNTGRQKIGAGDVFILFPGVRHRYRPKVETGWHEYWVGFSGEHAHRLWNNGLFSPDRAVHTVGFSTELLTDFEQIISLCRQQTPGFQVRLGALVLQLLAHIHAIETQSGTSSTDSEYIQKARLLMQEHLESGITVGEIASHVGAGYTQLLRYFRQYTGLTPYQYFLQMRIHRAQELLHDPNLSIKEIAARLQFENQYYFSRLFRKKTGMSPSQWRSAGGVIS